ncbi:surface lipoprotein assembly modifier [[Pseudomonas] boreopolis]|uniref:Peptide signal protein n=1 Tax=Xanthomonas boreopolis TaxID=86183 RepID=A0A919F5Y3_9XANT|nr:peptide signal protein [[Pseudomonas] boreopolis]
MHSILPARHPRATLFALASCLLWACTHAGAQEQDDLRRILEQRGQYRAIERERELLKDELEAARPSIVVDGKTYPVGHNASDIGRALYLSLQRKQWNAARRFLDEYLALTDRDPLLVHYAQGTLARNRGDLGQAQREYRALLALKPDFLPGRLELARVLFEDQQDREAERSFAAIAASLDDDPRTAGVRRTVAAFQEALANRRRWNGSFALGPAWSDNLNRSSAGSTCLIYLGGDCFFSRRTPAPIVAAGYDYDANLDKRMALRGHHGFYLRALAFGQGYRDNSAYDELTAIAQAGYSYRSGRHSVMLAPSFEYYAWGREALYGAWGAHAEWNWMLSPRSLLKLEGDWKAMRYRRAGYAANYDGATRSLYATWFRSLGTRWTVFGGLDVVDSDAAQAAYGYVQRGARLGGSLQWPEGFSGTLFASFRQRDYGAYSALLGARRQDDEQGYTFVLKATRLGFAGFTPLLTLRRNRIRSNVDWLYSYDKNAVSLKLERLL